MAAAKYRLRAGSDDFGSICPTCASPKNLQARRCVRCYRESLRTETYWLSRTCTCGGPKDTRSSHCIRCEHDARRADGSRFAVAREQPEWHPWRIRREPIAA